MKKYFVLAAMFLCFQLFSQVRDTLTLDFCLQQARLNYPLLKQKEILTSSSALKMKNLGISYLPQIFLNGQATYQSDVTSIPISIPGQQIPEVSKDMYKLNMDMSEMIYDGGLTKKQKKLEKAVNEVDQENIEVELYKLKENVNQLYFTILLLQQNHELLDIAKNELKNNLLKIESGIRNGVMTSSNADVLKVEIIKLDEQLLEADYSKLSAMDMLGIYINAEISKEIFLKIPKDFPDISLIENRRRELNVFDLQKKKLDISKSLISSRTLPKVSGFLQFGYGRPALNMLSNDFAPFYILGARLSWNLWNWNQNKNDRSLIDLQTAMIDNQKEIFERGLQLIKKKYVFEIQKLEHVIQKDNEIIVLRSNILKTASSQFENGTITATEYMTEKNAELQAKLNLESHKLQLIQIKVDYLTNFGMF